MRSQQETDGPAVKHYQFKECNLKKATTHSRIDIIDHGAPRREQYEGLGDLPSPISQVPRHSQRQMATSTVTREDDPLGCDLDFLDEVDVSGDGV